LDLRVDAGEIEHRDQEKLKVHESLDLAITAIIRQLIVAASTCNLLLGSELVCSACGERRNMMDKKRVRRRG
jgi:hypothetical protein